jgi:hypothetical protein
LKYCGRSERNFRTVFAQSAPGYLSLVTGKAA